MVRAAVCSIGELGDRVAKALRRGVDVAVFQCRHAPNGGGERLGDSRHAGALLEGLLGETKGLRQKAPEKQSLSVIDGQDYRRVCGIQRRPRPTRRPLGQSPWPAMDVRGRSEQWCGPMPEPLPEVGRARQGR